MAQPPASSRERTASRGDEPHLVRLLRSVALPEPRAHVNPFRVGDDDLVAVLVSHGGAGPIGVVEGD